MTCRTKHTGNKQQGFTLLEVLIALLVLSIGLLGLAALQTTGLRSNEMASMRTTATHLAYDITDRMRANPAGVAANEYQLVAGDTPTDTSSVAKNDLVEWYTEVTRLLPDGRASITQCGACTELTHTVMVQWNESRNPNATVNNNCPPVNNTDLRCFSLVYSE